MPIRPARTLREVKGPAWTRISKKVPRKAYIKALPHLALTVTSMGDATKTYSHRVDLTAQCAVQIRDNALEAARIAINKLLEREISGDYHFFVTLYPHHIVREIRMVFGAGADRIQKGMKHAWGKPAERVARVKKGTIVFTTRVNEDKISTVKAAYEIGRKKLPGSYKIVVTKIA